MRDAMACLKPLISASLVYILSIYEDKIYWWKTKYVQIECIAGEGAAANPYWDVGYGMEVKMVPRALILCNL